MRPDLAKAIQDLTFRMRLLRAGQEAQGGNIALSEREMLILELLAKNGQMSVSQLSLADSSASDSTISTTITRLWRNKLVSKTIKPENQRTTIIDLTEKGKKTVDVINRQRAERFQTLFEAINTTGSEEEAILNVTNRAIKFLDERLGIRNDNK